MTTFTNSLNEDFDFQNNLVVKIDSTYFAKYQPDSGLVIDDNKLLVDGATINPTQIDLRRAVTQTNTCTVKMLDGTDDDDFVFSAFIGADDNALVGKEIEIYFGRVGESIPFADYILISKYLINDITKTNNFFNIKAKSQEDKTITSAFDQEGFLDASINDSVLSVAVETDEDTFPASGIIKINREYLRYSSKVFLSGITTFTIDARGDLLSEAAEHDAGDLVNYVETLQGNPIDLILQLLISSGGGGTYDVLSDGAGIDESLIDITEFESIRDTFFSGDVFTLYAVDLDSLIEFIEQELMIPNNVRLIKNSLDNLISLAVLDQSSLLDAVETIGDDITLKDTGKWKVSKNGLQTVVKVKWNWVEGLQKFTRSKTFKADQSVLDVFGETKGIKLEFKGVQEANNGSVIAADRAARYLARFGTPKMTVDLAAFSTAFKHNIGDKIRVQAKHLPQEGGGLGLNTILELVKRAVNTSTGIVKMQFNATSYSNLRRGLISPSPALNLTITNQRTFEVPDGSCYEVGYALVLWDLTNNEYFTDAVNIVESIDGNFITMENDFTTTLGSNVALFFAEYDDASEAQRSLYAFTAPNTNFFADESKAYQIFL